MGNYYTKVSTMLDLGDEANVPVAMAIATPMEQGLFPLAEDTGQIASASISADHEHAKTIEPEPLGFQIQAEGDGQIAIFEDEYAEPSRIVDFVLACAARFGLTGLWRFEVARDASKPYSDAYGGSCYLLNLGEQQIVHAESTADLLDRTEAGLIGVGSSGATGTAFRNAVDAALRAAAAIRPDLTPHEREEMRILVAGALSRVLTKPPADTGVATQ